MQWLAISLPLMILALAVATVPLVVAMAHQRRHDLAASEAVATPGRPRLLTAEQGGRPSADGAAAPLRRAA